MALDPNPERIDGIDLVLDKPEGRLRQRLDESFLDEWHVGLPAQPTPLLGREGELEALSQTILGGTRLLTLTGPGGVGKTRLAIALAEKLEHAYSDGAVLVDLAAADEPDIVPASIARTLGVPIAARRSVLDSLVRHIGSRRLLLLLDNFEHVIAAASALGETLARCPELTVIVTSREPLHLRWERVQAISPLSLPELNETSPADLESFACVQLFVQRAQAIRPDFTLTESNARDVAEICVRLDGLPLAIELQAARINILTLPAMVARLGERFSLLHRPAPDVPARHHSLEAALDWSYDLLNLRERVVLQRLAVFVGGFDLEMAATVAIPTGTGVEVVEQLASLLDKSLVVASSENGRDPRFRLLESVRAYVLERARGEDELEPARERHCAYFLALAEQSPAESDAQQQRIWLSRLDRESGNLSEARQWAAYHDGETEIRLAIALIPFWRARGQVREGERCLTEALTRHPDVDATLRVEALDGLANLLQWEGRFEPAKEAIDEALSLARSLDVPELVDRLLINQGMLLIGQGDIDAARIVLQEALEGWRRLNDPRGAALTIEYQGLAELAAGDYTAARSLLEESLSMLQELGDGRRVAGALIALARLAGVQGETKRSAVLLVEALRLCHELNDHRMTCVAVEQAAGLLSLAAQPMAVAELLVAASATRDAGGLARTAQEEATYADALAALTARAGQQSINDWLAASTGPDLEHAADRGLALLADVASPTTRPRATKTDTGRLSRREYEVLQLVAQGLSNKQIAHMLFISENTVKYHVTSLLNKLGADSRAQTVALAAQLNLLQMPG